MHKIRFLDDYSLEGTLDLSDLLIMIRRFYATIFVRFSYMPYKDIKDHNTYENHGYRLYHC